MKKRTPSIPSRMDFIGKSFYIIAIIIVLVLLLLIVFVLYDKIFRHDTSPGSPLIDQSGTFGLILTGITITIASSIFIPRITLKREVEDEVRDQLDMQLKTRLQSFRAELIESHKYELSRTDAHLSRMISFLIGKDYPIWSIGWTFRSLKRYLVLEPSRAKVSLIEYNDLLVLLKIILNNAHRGFIDGAKSYLKDSDKDNVRDISKASIFEALVKRFKTKEARLEKEELRLAFRTCKDVIDAEYIFFTDNPIDDYDVDPLERVALKAEIKDLFLEINLTIRVLLLILQNSALPDNEISKSLLRISTIDKERMPVYKQKIEKLLARLRKETERAEILDNVINYLEVGNYEKRLLLEYETGQ